jgi:gliding motility-associated protein GldL
MSIESKIEAWVSNKKFKKFLSRLYGFGASVVILGALFKIEHWNGASYMLSVGLITESIIFFFYAFDSSEEAPEVVPSSHGAATTIFRADGTPMQMGSGGSVIPYNGPHSAVALAKFDEMLLEADISVDTFERLGMGIRKLGETTDNLNTMGDVAEASQRYMKTLQTADSSLDRLTKTYETAIGKVTSSTIFKYQAISKSLNVIERETQSYQVQVEMLNDNLSILNKIYRRQRKEAENYLQNLSESAEESAKYQERMHELNDNIQSLNQFYGGVLSSLNVRRSRGLH